MGSCDSYGSWFFGRFSVPNFYFKIFVIDQVVGVLFGG